MCASVSEKKWALAMYAVWDNHLWEEIQIDKENCFLILSHTQLLIVSKDMALESLDLLGGFCQIEPFFMSASIVIYVADKTNNTSKFKICLADGFRNKSDLENCLEVVEELQKFMSVKPCPSHKGKMPNPPPEKTLPELARQMFKEKRFSYENALESIMKEKISKTSIQMFLLDPRMKSSVNKPYQFLSSVKSSEDCGNSSKPETEE